jgi:hypothetical protein
MAITNVRIGRLDNTLTFGDLCYKLIPDTWHCGDEAVFPRAVTKRFPDTEDRLREIPVLHSSVSPPAREQLTLLNQLPPSLNQEEQCIEISRGERDRVPRS